MLRLVITCVVSIHFLTTPLFGMDVLDAFASSDHPQREAERGDWQFHDGMASVVADPELYKKYANHGPILKWTVDCSQGITSFDMHPSECQRVVFTLNGDGHVFRISLIDPEKGMTPFQKKGKSRMIAWAEKSSKDNKGDSFQPKGFPMLGTLNNTWTTVRVSLQGETATITIGDFQAELTHPAMKREKKQITLSFASGRFQVRNFAYHAK